MLTALLIGGLVAGTVVMSQNAANAGKGSSIKMPSAQAASNTSKTAAPVTQMTDTEKMNKRLAASSLTKNWAEPKLGKTGLLGLGTP
ncbi:MAG: hypothetical protein KKB59_18560 [Spirochaetes bacterium]|nr:hypothetical protein [Spirochaetota bacterium]